MLNLVTLVTEVTLVTRGNATYERLVTQVTQLRTYLAMLALPPIKGLVYITPIPSPYYLLHSKKRRSICQA